MPLLEQNIYAAWLAKQTAKGSVAAVPTRRLIQLGGTVQVNRADGSENYSDLSKYGAATDWVDSLVGTAETPAEASPTELAYLLWLLHGAETVTAVTGPPLAQKHTFIPSSGIGHPFTLWTRHGQTVIRRHRHADCYVTRLVVEGSTANKAVRMTPRILSLDPAENIAADPAGVNLPAERPFLYTDVRSTTATSFTIDGVVFNGQTNFSLVIDDAWDVVYGDDTGAFEFVQGTPLVTLAVTAHFDPNAAAELNKLLYGAAAPAAGTKPIKQVAALGSYLFHMKQRDAAGALLAPEFRLSVPGVKWAIPDAPPAAPDGGAAELTLSGAMRPTTPFVPGTGWATPPYTIDVNTPNAIVAFTG